jgi:hypothetical protein
MRNPLANIAASPKENLMVRPVAANVVRISVDQMPLLLRRLEGVLPKERLCAQLPHVSSDHILVEMTIKSPAGFNPHSQKRCLLGRR